MSQSLGKDADATDSTIRFMVLITLCCQNAGHALLVRYSHGILKESYSSTEVVLVAEVMKLFVSGYLAVTERAETGTLQKHFNFSEIDGDASDAVGNGAGKLLWLASHSEKIIVLVVLYSIANMLSYYALARVDASVYTVLLQLKIFTTPVFAVLLLHRNISSTKWRALMLLVLGCILVASPAYNRPTDCNAMMTRGKENDDENVSVLEVTLGIGAVLLMVTISGYSAIYFEAMLKKVGERVTIWERNFQLALYSILLLISLVVWEMMHDNRDENMSLQQFIPFQGWTLNAFFISVLQAGGGLLVAATLKYADAVLKTLATSGSIVISAILGYLLLGGQLDIFVSIGCVATILAIFNYTLDA